MGNSVGAAAHTKAPPAPEKMFKDFMRDSEKVLDKSFASDPKNAALAARRVILFHEMHEPINLALEQLKQTELPKDQRWRRISNSYIRDGSIGQVQNGLTSWMRRRLGQMRGQSLMKNQPRRMLSQTKRMLARARLSPQARPLLPQTSPILAGARPSLFQTRQMLPQARPLLPQAELMREPIASWWKTT